MSTSSENPQVNVNENKQSYKCCNWLRFNDVKEAQGYNLLGIGRGPLTMSNLFFSASLLSLATEASVCEENIDTGTLICKIYGFRPGSLIPNIALIAGLMAAFTMPFIGALVDYSPHRRLIGILSAAFMIFIQAIQIGTVSATWFPMAILQAIAGFVYQVQVLTTYAYLPDISRIVGESHMTNFTSIWHIVQFAASLLFLIVVSFVALFAGLDDVATGQMSQGLNVLCSGLALFFGWKVLPNVPTLQAKPEGQSYFVAGFSKLWNTAKGINSNYGGSVRWYFVAVAFGEAGLNAFSTLSITYLNEVLEMSGAELGIVYAIAYIASFPGSRLGYYVSMKTNPIFSWKACFVFFSVSIISAGFVLTGPKYKNISYFWFFLFGISLGWAYPVENLIFSMCIPKGQEAELSGFFVYCTQVIVWIPPLIFTAINESGVSMQYALMSLCIFFFIALVSLTLMDPWDSVLESAKTNKIISDSAEEKKSEPEEAV